MTFTTKEGLEVALGFNRRQLEPDSLKYSLINFSLPAATAVDLNQPIFFWEALGKQDVRWPCENQATMGACSAFGAENAACEAYAMSGGSPVDLDKDWAYWRARMKENGGTPNPNDVGSDPADVLDLCRTGVVPQSAQPEGYVADPGKDFSYLDAYATLRYVNSFHAIHPQDGDMRLLVAGALASGYPVNMASLWTDAMFGPTNGLMPQGQTPAMAVGAHDYRCYGWIPARLLPSTYRYGAYACRNNWTPQWGQAENSNVPNVQAGDFLVPAEYGVPNNIIQIAYAVVGIAVAPPKPKPSPNTALAKADAMFAQEFAMITPHLNQSDPQYGYWYWANEWSKWNKTNIDKALTS